MKIANYTPFYRDLRTNGIAYAINHSAMLGFDAVEFLTTSDHDLPNIINAKETAKRLSDSDLSVSCYSVAVDLFGGDLNEKRERMARNIELAAALGAPFFHHTLYTALSLTPQSPSFAEMLQGVLPQAEYIATRCREYGIICLYEPQGMYFNGIDGLSQLLSAMRSVHTNIGVCGDSGNSYFADVDPVAVFQAFAEDIRHVHIKDYRYTEHPIPAEEHYISRGGKHIAAVSMGEGDVDIPALLNILRSVNYNGALSLEFGGNDTELKAAIQRLRSLCNI